MRLRFIYMPVSDVAAAAAFYRDELGFEEDWREGSGTIAFKLPGSNVALLLDEDPAERGAGPFLVVASVTGFYRRNRERLTFIEEPRPIGPGMYARFTDPSGNVIRIMDDTTSSERDRPV